MTVDNVWYVLKLDAAPTRQFGWSRGPDTPDVGGWHDWPIGGFNNAPGTTWTFHWINQDQTVGADTQEPLQTLIAFPAPAWRHLKTRTTETTGTWYITDNVRLVALIREAALTFGGATRNALNAWATFIETSPLIPRVGDP